MNRRGRKQGAPGSDDQFKRGAATADSESAQDESLRQRSDPETDSEGDEHDPPAAQADGAAEEIEAESELSTRAGAPRADFEQQLDEQRDKYLRLAAEYDNFRKRTAKERQEGGVRAQAELARQLLDGLDDLARVAHVDPGSVETASVVQGVELVEKKFLKALTGAGLEVVNPVDQPFDPAMHEAVATEPALSPEDDHMISRVYQHGYVFAGQLLRPARVVVKQWNG